LKIHGFFVRAIDWLGERLGARNWLRRACAIAGYAIAAALDFVYYSFKRDDKGERLLAAREAHSKFWKNVILLDASTSLLSLDAMKFAHERTLQLIRDIDIPTMIVWGKYDTFVEEPTRYLSTHSNPNIQFLELQRGHFLHLESDVFAEKAAQFMAKQVACTSK
jgi:pimeloyl-ACP methyl ester carboxylesterase